MLDCDTRSQKKSIQEHFSLLTVNQRLIVDNVLDRLYSRVEHVRYL
jgi:hypothetical protein